MHKSCFNYNMVTWSQQGYAGNLMWNFWVQSQSKLLNWAQIDNLFFKKVNFSSWLYLTCLNDKKGGVKTQRGINRLHQIFTPTKWTQKNHIYPPLVHKKTKLTILLTVGCILCKRDGSVIDWLFSKS